MSSLWCRGPSGFASGVPASALSAVLLDLGSPDRPALWPGFAPGVSGGNADRYLRFMEITQHQCQSFGGQHALGRNPLKALDEYNCCHYTRKWALAATDRAPTVRPSGATLPRARRFQDAPGTHQLSYVAQAEHPETRRTGSFLPSTPLSYDLLRLPNVLWEQGVASSNLAVPTSIQAKISDLGG